MERRNVARQILRLLSSDRGMLPGLTLGGIEIALSLHPGTATHQRITELRRYGWDIRTDRETNRYYVLARERERARKFLAKYPSFIAAAVERRRRAA